MLRSEGDRYEAYLDALRDNAKQVVTLNVAVLTAAAAAAKWIGDSLPILGVVVVGVCLATSAFCSILTLDNTARAMRDGRGSPRLQWAHTAALGALVLGVGIAAVLLILQGSPS